jgi:hypothetical protein
MTHPAYSIRLISYFFHCVSSTLLKTPILQGPALATFIEPYVDFFHATVPVATTGFLSFNI